MAQKFRFPFVVVVWDDAEGDAGWSEVPHTELQPTLMQTIGFLVVDSPNYVMLADSYEISPNSKVIGGTNKIPRGMIKEMYEVTITKKRKPQVESGTSGT